MSLVPSCGRNVKRRDADQPTDNHHAGQGTFRNPRPMASLRNCGEVPRQVASHYIPLDDASSLHHPQLFSYVYSSSPAAYRVVESIRLTGLPSHIHSFIGLE